MPHRDDKMFWKPLYQSYGGIMQQHPYLPATIASLLQRYPFLCLETRALPINQSVRSWQSCKVRFWQFMQKVSVAVSSVNWISQRNSAYKRILKWWDMCPRKKIDSRRSDLGKRLPWVVPYQMYKRTLCEAKKFVSRSLWEVIESQCLFSERG